MVDLDIMVAEGVARLRLLGLSPSVIHDFQNGVVHVSEWSEYDYVVNTDIAREITALQYKTGYWVYHVLHVHTHAGHQLALFYVNDDIDSWEDEHKALKQSVASAMVVIAGSGKPPRDAQIRVSKSFGDNSLRWMDIIWKEGNTDDVE